MHPSPRHRCLIYEGAPSRQLPALAAVMRDQLHHGNRCMYLDSPPMVSGMRSYLAAIGVDVEREVSMGSLVISSERGHLTGDRFDVDRMMIMLDEAVSQALNDGYRGLWATGDMTWELGPEQDFSRLLEYEWQLEELFLKHPSLSGICQYRRDSLPKQAVRHGFVSHASIFINETLSRINPYYTRGDSARPVQINDLELDRAITTLSSAD